MDVEKDKLVYPVAEGLIGRIFCELVPSSVGCE